MEKKSKIIYVYVYILILATIALIGVTYAYYRTKIIGNGADKSISVTSQKLEIIYEDGNGIISATEIEPGYTATKTFTVENTGDAEINYAVYLEDVVNEYIRTSDWTYEITCSPKCNGTDGEIKYPKLSKIIAENVIDSKEIQTYTIKLNYASLKNIDQSVDMGKKLSGKFQIYALEDVVDIEGIVANASEGDYVQINSVQKNSQIVDGRYRLPSIEVGTHTLKVIDKDGIEKGKTNIMIQKGTQGIDGSAITIDDTSQSATLNIINIAENLEIEIKNINKIFVNPYQKGTLSYAILKDNEVSEPLTIPGQQASLDTEALLAATEDDFGTSYYFRGKVENNYVTYSNMCWRIVRVQGNGDIKITLADRDNPCGTANGYSADDADSAFVATTTQNFAYKYNSYYEESDFIYKSSDVGKVLSAWAGTNENRTYTYYDTNNNSQTNEFANLALDTEQLSNKPNWCNDTKVTKISYYDSDYNEVEAGSSWIRFSDFYYGAFSRLNSIKTANPSLKCAVNGENESIVGMLSADEIALAGSASAKASNYYLKTNATAKRYWTLSPYAFYENSYPNNFLVNRSGGLTSSYMGDPICSIRPAIVLKVDALLNSETNYIQDGTIDKPYVIES